MGKLFGLTVLLIVAVVGYGISQRLSSDALTLAVGGCSVYWLAFPAL